MRIARSKPDRSSARHSSPCSERRAQRVVSAAQTAEIKKRLRGPHRPGVARARLPTEPRGRGYTQTGISMR